MSLDIYTKPSSDPSYIVTNQTWKNPFRISFDGQVGGSMVLPFWLRNNDKKHAYASITLTINDTSVGAAWSTSPKWMWKLKQVAAEPLPVEWESVASMNSISVADIGNAYQGDIITFVPFWLYILFPQGLLAQTIKEVRFNLSAQKVYVVGV